MASTSAKLASIIGLLTLPAIMPAQQIAIGHYAMPSSGPNSYRDSFAITLGPDGAMWFTERFGNRIGRITTAGVVTEYEIPTNESTPCQIALGPDGALWFTEFKRNKIGRITTAGVITEYPVPTANSGPIGITAGQGGVLWFTESATSQIGRITTAGSITEFPAAPGEHVDPGAIATGPDGAIWFTHGPFIARLTSPGTPTVYSVPQSPLAIAVGPGGTLWFTLNFGNGLGSISTTGVVSTYPLSARPYGITAGADGAMWFTEEQAIGRITTAGVVTEYPLPVGYFFPATGPPGGNYDIAVGPDGELWFPLNAAFYSGASTLYSIGEAFFETASLTVTPDTGFFQTSHTFAGSGFAANETVRIFARGVGSAVLATAATDSTGAFTVSVQMPQASYGPQVYIGVGQTSHKLGAANFTVTPNLVLDPDSGPAGSTVTAKGYGFPPSSTVPVYWAELKTLLGTVATDINGTFDGAAALTFTVPAAASLGLNRVQGAWDWDCVRERPPVCSNSGYGTFTVE